MVLKLTDGGLMHEKIIKKTAMKNAELKSTLVKIAEQEGLYTVDEKGGKQYQFDRIKRGHNLANPIPYTTLSNMLIGLIDGIPVPTKPSKRSEFPTDLIKRPKICDELAKNSFFKIDSPVDPSGSFLKQVLGEDGEYYGIVDGVVQGAEFMQSEKTDLNSNLQIKTTLFVGDDGKPVEINGSYNFGMLLRLFNDDENHPGYKRLISFISEELGVEDVRKTHTFSEMAYAFYKKSSDEGYLEKIKAFFDEMNGPLWDGGNCIKCWFYAIFHYGEKSTSSNTSNNEDYITTKVYLRNRRGDKISRISVNGKIIVPMTDELMYELLKSGKGYCTFLDGGVATIDGFYVKEDLEDGFETTWKKISEEEPLQETGNQELA